MTPPACYLPNPPITLGAITHCAKRECGEAYEAALVDGVLTWVRSDLVIHQVAEIAQVTAVAAVQDPVAGDFTVREYVMATAEAVGLDPEKMAAFTATAEPEEEPEPEPEEVAFPTRVELLPLAQGCYAPMTLDMGQEPAILIQPKPDQPEGELGLNIIFGGGLTVDVVAWMLAQASEAIVRGERRVRLDLETP